MSTLVRVRRYGRRPVRLGRTNVSNSDYGSVVDLDDPIVRRDIRALRSSGLIAFVENKPLTTGSTNKRAIENINILDATSAVTPSTTKLHLSAVDLAAGQQIVSLGWVATATAAATSTASWAALFKVVGTNLTCVAVSANDATANGGFAANTLVNKNVFSSGTTQYVVDAQNARYYAGLVLVATTQPTLAGITLVSSALNGIASSNLLAGSEATAVRTTTPITAGTNIALSDVTGNLTLVPYVRVTTTV
jgi:hypothetical protein